MKAIGIASEMRDVATFVEGGVGSTRRVAQEDHQSWASQRLAEAQWRVRTVVVRGCLLGEGHCGLLTPRLATQSLGIRLHIMSGDRDVGELVAVKKVQLGIQEKEGISLDL